MDSLGVAARSATVVDARPDRVGLAERYGCALELQPSHLVPTRLLASLATDTQSRPLVVHPRAWLDGQPPENQEPVVADVAIHRDPWTLWVHCDGTGATWPYLLGESSAAAFAALQAGDAAAIEQSPRAAALLRAVGALVTPRELEEDCADWDRAMAIAADAFAAGGYAALGGLVHPFHLACLRARYRRLVRKGALRFGDTQSSRRYVAHDEPVARYFHAQLAPVVSRIARRAVKPSYVYLASYCAGAELPPHVDREQCEYTLAMCVDFTPEPRRETSWPLQLELRDGRIVVYQAIGDALVYKGREIPHFRDPLARGRTSTSLFFHYVDADFRGRLA